MKRFFLFLVVLLPGFVLAQVADDNFGQDSGQPNTTLNFAGNQWSEQTIPPVRESETVEGIIKAADLVLTGQVGNSTSSSHEVNGNVATKDDVVRIEAKLEKLGTKLSELLTNGASKEDIDGLKSEIAELRENTLPTDGLQDQLSQLEDRLKKAGFTDVSQISAEEAAEKDRAAKAAQNSAIVEEKNKDMENTLFVVLLVGLATAGLVAFFYLLFTRPRADVNRVEPSTGSVSPTTPEELEAVIASTVSDPRRTRSLVTGRVCGLMVTHRGTTDTQVITSPPDVVILKAGAEPRVVTIPSPALAPSPAPKKTAAKKKVDKPKADD